MRTISVKIPVEYYQIMRKAIRGGSTKIKRYGTMYVSISEFIREAIRKLIAEELKKIKEGLK